MKIEVQKINDMYGRFITFEGGEGVGKSTQVRLLSDRLIELGYKVHVTREPGGDEFSEKIRSLLKENNNIDSLCELLLIFAARRSHLSSIINPLIERGYIVICDRFYDSSLVYQGLIKNLSIENIMRLKYMIMGDFEPDLTLILDMDVKRSIERVNNRKLIADDAYDSMDESKHNIVRCGFQKIAEIFSFRSVLIKANGRAVDISNRIFNVINERILKTM